MLPVILYDCGWVLLVTCGVSVLVDRLSLESVLVNKREGLMSRVVPCKPGTGLTVGLGEYLTSKKPVSGL